MNTKRSLNSAGTSLSLTLGLVLTTGTLIGVSLPTSSDASTAREQAKQNLIDSKIVRIITNLTEVGTDLSYAHKSLLSELASIEISYTSKGILGVRPSKIVLLEYLAGLTSAQWKVLAGKYGVGKPFGRELIVRMIEDPSHVAAQLLDGKVSIPLSEARKKAVRAKMLAASPKAVTEVPQDRGAADSSTTRIADAAFSELERERILADDAAKKAVRPKEVVFRDIGTIQEKVQSLEIDGTQHAPTMMKLQEVEKFAYADADGNRRTVLEFLATRTPSSLQNAITAFGGLGSLIHVASEDPARLFSKKSGLRIVSAKPGTLGEKRMLLEEAQAKVAQHKKAEKLKKAQDRAAIAAGENKGSVGARALLRQQELSRLLLENAKAQKAYASALVDFNTAAKADREAAKAFRAANAEAQAAKQEREISDELRVIGENGGKNPDAKSPSDRALEGMVVEAEGSSHSSHEPVASERGLTAGARFKAMAAGVTRFARSVRVTREKGAQAQDIAESAQAAQTNQDGRRPSGPPVPVVVTLDPSGSAEHAESATQARPGFGPSSLPNKLRQRGAKMLTGMGSTLAALAPSTARAKRGEGGAEKEPLLAETRKLESQGGASAQPPRPITILVPREQAAIDADLGKIEAMVIGLSGTGYSKEAAQAAAKMMEPLERFTIQNREQKPVESALSRMARMASLDPVVFSEHVQYHGGLGAMATRLAQDPSILADRTQGESLNIHATQSLAEERYFLEARERAHAAEWKKADAQPFAKRMAAKAGLLGEQGRLLLERRNFDSKQAQLLAQAKKAEARLLEMSRPASGSPSGGDPSQKVASNSEPAPLSATRKKSEATAVQVPEPKSVVAQGAPNPAAKLASVVSEPSSASTTGKKELTAFAKARAALSGLTPAMIGGGRTVKGPDGQPLDEKTVLEAATSKGQSAKDPVLEAEKSKKKELITAAVAKGAEVLGQGATGNKAADDKSASKPFEAPPVVVIPGSGSQNGEAPVLKKAPSESGRSLRAESVAPSELHGDSASLPSNDADRLMVDRSADAIEKDVKTVVEKLKLAGVNPVHADRLVKDIALLEQSGLVTASGKEMTLLQKLAGMTPKEIKAQVFGHYGSATVFIHAVAMDPHRLVGKKEKLAYADQEARVGQKKVELASMEQRLAELRKRLAASDRANGITLMGRVGAFFKRRFGAAETSEAKLEKKQLELDRTNLKLEIAQLEREISLHKKEVVLLEKGLKEALTRSYGAEYQAGRDASAAEILAKDAELRRQARALGGDSITGSSGSLGRDTVSSVTASPSGGSASASKPAAVPAVVKDPRLAQHQKLVSEAQAQETALHRQLEALDAVERPSRQVRRDQSAHRVREGRQSSLLAERRHRGGQEGYSAAEIAAPLADDLSDSHDLSRRLDRDRRARGEGVIGEERRDVREEDRRGERTSFARRAPVRSGGSVISGVDDERSSGLRELGAMELLDRGQASSEGMASLRSSAQQSIAQSKEILADLAKLEPAVEALAQGRDAEHFQREMKEAERTTGSWKAWRMESLPGWKRLFSDDYISEVEEKKRVRSEAKAMKEAIEGIPEAHAKIERRLEAARRALASITNDVDRMSHSGGSIEGFEAEERLAAATEAGSEHSGEDRRTQEEALRERPGERSERRAVRSASFDADEFEKLRKKGLRKVGLPSGFEMPAEIKAAYGSELIPVGMSKRRYAAPKYEPHVKLWNPRTKTVHYVEASKLIAAPSMSRPAELAKRKRSEVMSMRGTNEANSETSSRSSR